VCIVPANAGSESAKSSVVAAHNFRSVVITVSPERCLRKDANGRDYRPRVPHGTVVATPREVTILSHSCATIF
jgi:hypothetical protein